MDKGKICQVENLFRNNSIDKMLNHTNSPLASPQPLSSRRGARGEARGVGGEVFYNLMYRIDISETQIKKSIEESKDKSFSEIVTDLILKRELLKVVTRRSFSNNL